MEKINYFDLVQFRGLFLEDSFVLGIVEKPNLISFQMEFVLIQNHPEYQNPLDNEMYCYRKGLIEFIEPEQVIWKNRNQIAISIDKNGEEDFGNIDVFFKRGNEYLLEGDWGSVLIKCEILKVKLQK